MVYVLLFFLESPCLLSSGIHFTIKYTTSNPFLYINLKAPSPQAQRAKQYKVFSRGQKFLVFLETYKDFVSEVKLYCIRL